MDLTQAVNSLPVKGYLNVEIPEGIDLIAEINRLRKEKNAIILAHYYQTGDIQDLSDFLGDSLQLARAAKDTDADMIVFCGVHFMAEAAKILNPEKKVVLPDLLAGCSLADSCTGEGLRQWKKQFENPYVVSYINCNADVKAESDLICTSSSAEALINQIPEDKTILFAPDKNLGAYIRDKTGRHMELWDGTCMVHEAFSMERIAQQMMDNPEAKMIAHPESEEVVLQLAEFIGSTSALIRYVSEDDAQEYIVATEEGIIHQMKKEAPGKKFLPALVNDENCACSECFYMKRNTMEKIYLCLKYEMPEIVIEEELRIKALAPIQRMLDMSQNVK